ncbi:MAG: methyltransferase domain-containing protein [Clostridia bacterium]|nr:methyltransferase domain-containing protein [Clostridia bacterium]
MVNYFYDCYAVLNKVYSEKAFIKQAINDTFIEETNRSLTVKICYGVIEKDIELSYYIEKMTEKTPKLAIRTILKISMYMIKYLDKKEYFVVQNAVELTKKLGKGGASGFVNAFLRKFSTVEIEFPKEKLSFLSIKYSYPLFAVKRLVEDYGEQRAESIISAPYPDNTLCFYGVDGEKYLTESGAEFSKTPFDNVFTVKNFNRNADYDKGVYTYQALGSVAICETVGVCEKLLDCCAAPGGKSVRLSYKAETVTAWDIHEHRVKLIEEYAWRMGRSNINTEVRDAKIYDDKYKDCFDAVLCDAPCSGFGVVGDNPDIKLNRTEEDLRAVNDEQKSILDTVCKYVKPNGYLYYSTCSVFKSENIDVVKWFLLRHEGFKLERVDSALFHEDIDGTDAFLPDMSFGNGFYIAKLKRIK